MAEGVVGDIEFAANPAGADLKGLAASVQYDPQLWEFLVPHGHLVMGRLSGGRYDPCAFDMNRRRGRDAPLVRIDHEQILSFNRLGQPFLLAESFNAFLAERLGRLRRKRPTG